MMGFLLRAGTRVNYKGAKQTAQDPLVRELTESAKRCVEGEDLTMDLIRDAMRPDVEKFLKKSCESGHQLLGLEH